MIRAISILIFYLVMQFAIGIATNAAIVYFDEAETISAATRTIIASGITNVLVIVIMLLMGWFKFDRNYVRTRPWTILFWTALLALGIILPLATLEELIPAAWRVDIVGDTMKEMLMSTEGYFMLAMLAPLTEEMVFRGAILKALLKWGEKKKAAAEEKLGHASGLTKGRIEWTAIVLTALLFAVSHLNPAQLPHAFIIGLLLGWITVKTGSILPAFVIHWVNNSFAYVMVNMYPNLPVDAPTIAYFGGSSTDMYKAIAFSLMIALPALYQLVTRLK